ncbi:MBL fold metallo-hydrolase [Paenibacillus sp.]|uniref:MBL fold metallo-hydrolase n=1 Tax=Paenibacillus sp. TaxID=58172 RepID=UPI002D51F1CC|nr:MBL fold metallo-hydrolase [Paenibacillus sp.]HZG58631.1 MBL fold metallo-hydrolase [Paenibacillus sp.]
MRKIHLLDIEFEYGGQRQTIVPALLEDERGSILIDCGYPEFLPMLEAAAARKGIPFSSIATVVLTHHDMDHIGSLAALQRAYPHIEVVAHEREKPYLEGTAKSLRLEQAEAMLGAMPDSARPQAEQFIRLLQSIEPARVDRTVADGERLPWFGGMEIVPTPGHMPGHISIYLPAEKTLIAGDAVVVEDGRLNLANPQFALDMEEAVRSVRKLLDYDIERLICYHGGELRGGIKEALLDVLERYEVG